jgi:hypothetical protein
MACDARLGYTFLRFSRTEGQAGIWARYRSISTLECIRQCGDTGSVPPPTSTPSGLDSRACQPDAARRCKRAGNHHVLSPVAASAGPGGGSCALLRQRACLRPVRAAPWSTLLHIGYAARTAQVIGLGCFRTTRRHGHRPARYMKGPPQVRLGSMRGQRNGRGRPCEPALAQPAVPAWQRKGPATAQPAPFCPSRAVPRARTLWAMRGPDRRLTHHLRGSGGDGGAVEIHEERFGEPLLLPGFRPLYVRNHRYGGAHSGTS